MAKRIKPDIIHLPNTMPLFIKISPTVVTIHDLMEKKYPSSYKKSRLIARKINLRMIAKKSNYVVAVSNYTKKAIIKNYKSTKVVVIYHGTFSFHRSSDNMVGKDKISLPSKYILFVGVLDPHKNVTGLIKAWYRLPDKIREKYKLVLVGRDGRDSKNVWNLIKYLKLREDVIFLSDVDDQTLAQIYRKASLFVFPSFMEGFGLPVVEAMASGVPVITSNTSALSEICGDAAILVNPYSIEELAEAMEQVLSKKTLVEELINKGERRAELFSWERAAKETLYLYRKVFK